ncbi:MAG: FAA hydrolase family protein, partial [Alcaligenaceae bacterium]
MKICRFNENRIGVVLGDEVADVTSTLDALARYSYPFPRGDIFVEQLSQLRGTLEELATTAIRIPLKNVSLLSPVANPGKIVAAPVNYFDHFAEATGQAELHHGNQIQGIQKAGLFLKATSSLVGCSQGVFLEHMDRRNDHEVELVAVIGKTCRNVPKEKALDYVAGYCIGLDMSVRGTED